MLNNILNIEGASVLTKEQQKSIIGGGGTCGVYLPPGWTPQLNFIVEEGDFHIMNSDGSKIWGGITHADAQNFIFNSPGAHWCCDSCGSAAWYTQP